MEPVNENKDEEIKDISGEEIKEVSEEKDAVMGTTEVAESTQAEGDKITEEVTAEELGADQAVDSKEMLKKKIKIGVVIAGGVFIIIAAVYMAAVFGGRNVAIQEEEPVEEVAQTVEESIVEEKPVITEAVEEEEDSSLIAVIKSSNKYDDCVYADGGVVIVQKEDKYGAVDYKGNEIAPVDYAELIQYPTDEGLFVLANSKNETVTEENDGTSYTYEDVVYTYTLFDNTGKKVYEGNNDVVASGKTYVLGIVDKKDNRQNRAEYYRIGKSEAYMTLYVNDQFSLNGFKDGKTVVMGFTAAPTEDQDTNPTNLKCGIMDENGKVTWFSSVPGMSDFEEKVEAWKAENKELQIIAEKNKKEAKKKAKEENDEEEIDEEEIEEEDDGIVYFDEDGNIIEKEKDVENEEEVEDDEELEEDDIVDEEDIEEIDASNGPVFKMDEILSAPCGGYFIYNDLYDVEDPYSWYTSDGKWYADLDTAYMQPDDKKGFAIGNFNNGAVSIKSYISNGEKYYNYGSLMVLHVGEKDVLIDMSLKEGMTVDSLTDKIVLATFDEISISDASYWMYRDGDVYGYLDLKGERVKLTYEAATGFVNGYALVIKNGYASLIDETFTVVEDICEATEVSLSGDVLKITSGGETKPYIIKTVRDEFSK